MASPSRMTTRSTPRTSRALAWMPSRRAAPTRASAASGPGQVTSSAEDRPGSVSEPCAMNAPRQAASASQAEALTTLRRQPAHRAAAGVDEAGLAGQRLAVLDHPHDVAAALAQAAGGEDEHLGGVAVEVGDVLAQPPGGVGRVELGLDDDAAADDVQPTGEPQRRRHLRLAAARLRDVEPAELVLDPRRHRHGVILPSRRRASALVRRTRLDQSAPPALVPRVDQSSEDVTVRRGEPQRVMVAGCAALGHRRPRRPRRRAGAAASRSSSSSSTAPGSASTASSRRPRRVVGERLELPGGRRSRPSPPSARG